MLAPDAFGASIGAELVDLWGCGIWSAVTPEGVLLRPAGVPGMANARSLGGGRYASQEIGGGGAEFLAQVAGTAVTASWTGGVRGHDLGTGAERGRWEPGDAAGIESFGGVYVTRAFTDGRFLLLLLPREAGGVGVVSLDAASGELAWDWSAMKDDVDLPHEASFLSIGGHLLAVSPMGVTGLG